MKCKICVLKILVLFAPLLFCMRLNAQALPTPSADTFSTIINGNNSLSFSLFSDVNVLPINPNPVNIYRIVEDVAQDPLIVGTQLNLMQNNDYTVSELTQSEIDDFSQIYPYLYDVNGNIVTWDNVYHVHYMNAMFHGDVYIDDSGNILTSDQNNTNTMFQLGVGGYLLGVSDIANIYDEIQQSLVNNSYQYILEGIPNPNSAYYLFFSPYGGLNANKVYSFYIPNQYLDGVIVPTTSNNGQIITEWYSNDTSSFTYIGPSGNEYNVSIQNGSWVKNGYTYQYKITFPTNYRVDRFPNVNNSYSSFLNGNQWNDPNVFAKVGINYIPSNSTNSSIVDFKKIIDLPSTKHLQFDDTYDYNFIKEYESSLNNSTPQLNELYDPAQSINESNYPYSYETPENLPDNESSSLPFPSTNVDPNPEASPFLSYDPLIQPTPEATVQSFWNFQIPFVENLFKKYPFSIPWDIKNFFLGFTSQAQAPAWDFDYTITIAGKDYTTHFEGDLSDYEPLAVIFRNLITISFIIFLAVYSYFKHS